MTNEAPTSLSDLRKQLNKNELFIVEIKLGDKVVGEYNVTKDGISGSIIIKDCINFNIIQRSYEVIKLIKIQNKWLAKINGIFNIIATKYLI